MTTYEIGYHGERIFWEGRTEVSIYGKRGEPCGSYRGAERAECGRPATVLHRHHARRSRYGTLAQDREWMCPRCRDDARRGWVRPGEKLCDLGPDAAVYADETASGQVWLATRQPRKAQEPAP